jgi:hypothetical protein
MEHYWKRQIVENENESSNGLLWGARVEIDPSLSKHLISYASVIEQVSTFSL